MTLKYRLEFLLVNFLIVVFVSACSSVDNGPGIDSRRTYNESWWRYTGDLSPSGAGFDYRLYLLQDQEDDWSCAVSSTYSGGTLLSHVLFVGRLSGEQGKLEWIRDIESLGERISHYSLAFTLAADSLRMNFGNRVTYTRLDSAMEPTPGVPVDGQFTPEKSRTGKAGQTTQAGLRMQCEKDIALTRKVGTYALQRQYNPEYFARIKKP